MTNLCMLMFALLLSTVFGRTANNTKPVTPNSYSNLLHKFHQNDYKIAFERIELARFNKSFGEAYMRTFKYNRTTPLVNASFVSTVNMGYDLEIIVQAYKFASNEYRLFPLRFEVNACSALASAAAGVNKFSNFGNIQCPVVKGKKYYFYNFAPEEAKLPPFIPTGKYMVELQFMYHDMEVFVTKNFGDVYRPIVIE